MQALPLRVPPLRLLRLSLLLMGLSFCWGSEVVVGYQKAPPIEETVPESLRGDAKIAGLVSQLKLARRSLAVLGAAHPSYGKTKNLVGQLETTLAREISSRMSGFQGNAGNSTDSQGVSESTNKPPMPVDRGPAARPEVDSGNPSRDDLPELRAAFQGLPIRRLTRLGVFPSTRILWGLESVEGSVSSRLWKWGDFERATAQKVFVESGDPIFDIRFPDDFLQSDVCYVLTDGQKEDPKVIRLLRWQILDAGDPSPRGRQETQIGVFRTEEYATARFAGGQAEPLVVLLSAKAEFTSDGEREILASPDEQSFLIDSKSVLGSLDTFRSVAETSRRAWDSGKARGPLVATNRGLLFVSPDPIPHSDTVQELVTPAFFYHATGQISSVESYVPYRGTKVPWLVGKLLWVSKDLRTIQALEIPSDGDLISTPIARSRHDIFSLGESSDLEILIATEKGLATLDTTVAPPGLTKFANREELTGKRNGEVELGLLEKESEKALDPMAKLQSEAYLKQSATWGHWGSNPGSYVTWADHSNRLIPVYSFGASLSDFQGANSAYRSEEKLKRLYGRLPAETLNPEAEYFDQTDLFELQRRALQSGKKYLFLVIFDGMDWQTTWAAATYAAREVRYREGRGSGLSFQDYSGAETDFGFVVTSPLTGGCQFDPDAQRLTRWGEEVGGYSSRLGGRFPWSPSSDLDYLTGRSKAIPHTFTDSTAAATSISTGIKTFNGSVNIGPDYKPLTTIAHLAQLEYRMSVGAVTSVTICDATVAAAYAHNVSRDDFQDISRDLLGLPSISHRMDPLPGLDVLMGAGFGVNDQRGWAQGSNFLPGNEYIAEADLQRVSVEAGGNYRIAKRTSGQNGAVVLKEALDRSLAEQSRLIGFFGTQYSSLPFQTANGDWTPVGASPEKAEKYSLEDIEENPTLAEMTYTAIRRLERNPNGFWLLVESGDVDRANHRNNLDDSIGAVLSGADAFDTIVRWIEQRDGWDESLVVVTADHGHAFCLTQPEVIAQAAASEFSMSSTAKSQSP
jgi:alkaline phosphatase